jgi:hypothetical protein
MTDPLPTTDPDPEASAAPEPVTLPTLVKVSTAFAARMPSQRVLDVLAKTEGADFGTLATSQPFRIVAFRALLRDFPTYDVGALWRHAYDTEVEVEDANPMNGSSPTAALGSVASGG